MDVLVITAHIVLERLWHPFTSLETQERATDSGRRRPFTITEKLQGVGILYDFRGIVGFDCLEATTTSIVWEVEGALGCSGTE